MPSLLSNHEVSTVTGAFGDLFDTFSRPVIVHKEPLKSLNPTQPTNPLFGFGESQTQDSYIYTPVTGIFQAMIRYQTLITRDEFRVPSDTNIRIPEGGCSIKVRQEGRDYINTGKTDKIIVDSRTYYLDSDFRAGVFLTAQYWIYILKPTL